MGMRKDRGESRGGQARSLAPTILWFALGASSLAHAQVPLPPDTKSLEMFDDGVIVFTAPNERAGRRGTIMLGTRTPALGRVLGVGCGNGVFLQVGVDAFICEHDARPSVLPPDGIEQPIVPAGELVPHDYRTVIADATPTYARPSDYDADMVSGGLSQDFVIAVRERVVHDGVELVRNRAGDYIVNEGLRAATPSTLSGVAVGPGDDLDFGWARRDRVALRLSKSARGKVIRHADRHELLRPLRDAGDGWLLTRDGHFIDARDVARPIVGAALPDLKDNERWIDVDTAQQVLIAFEGTRPVFATLMSSGLATEERATPLGVFSIWAKLAESDMGDLEREDIDHHYSIEGVPWVQYFHADNALHGAFWHNHFGTRVSHGCVNLSPRDARFLFGWTNPILPKGWSAILPTEHDPATRVRVR